MVKKTNAFALVLLAACSRTPSPGKIEPSTEAGSPPGPRSSSSSSSISESSDASAVSTCKGDATKGVTCRRFATAEEAFRQVVGTDAQVLAVGEAHAQKGTEAIASSTKRFTDQLLPAIASRSGDIIVELWAPDPKCQKEVKAVASAQKPVTETQAATNTNEYQTLGVKAKELGLTPWLLRPTCEDFSTLADAGADAVPAMLGLVKRLTQQKVTQLLEKNVKAQKLTIAYGGALHNDVAPPEATAPFSFGPDLVKATGGKYVELDLIVPEFVKKTPVWEKLPWYAAFSSEEVPRDRATLYTMSTTPPSYVLVFPSTSTSSP